MAGIIDINDAQETETYYWRIRSKPLINQKGKIAAGVGTNSFLRPRLPDFV
jgi:hypothetical protein